MLHAARFVSVPRICALLATLVIASHGAEAATQPAGTSILDAQPSSSLQTSKSKSKSRSSSRSRPTTKSTPRSTPRATPTKAKTKTTVCCTGCDACRKRAAKNGVRVK